MGLGLGGGVGDDGFAVADGDVLAGERLQLGGQIANDGTQGPVCHQIRAGASARPRRARTAQWRPNVIANAALPWPTRLRPRPAQAYEGRYLENWFGEGAIWPGPSAALSETISTPDRGRSRPRLFPRRRRWLALLSVTPSLDESLSKFTWPSNHDVVRTLNLHDST